MTLVIRAPGAHMRIASAVRESLAALDPRLPLSEIKAMEQAVYERRSPKELMMWTLVVFSMMALMMAAVGTYAVMAYAVAQRTHEIGVRMALGARKSQVLAQILREGMVTALAGTALGVVGAAAIGRALQGMVHGMDATDPIMLVVVSLTLLLAALVACVVPARRAATVDPMVALRES